MKAVFTIACAFAALVLMSGCVRTNRTIREPNHYVQFKKEDFSFSQQVEAERTMTQIFCINFDFLKSKKTAEISDRYNGGLVTLLSRVPIVGEYIFPERAAMYAMFRLLEDNPGYDVIFYPQVETKISRPILGIGFLYKRTRVKVKARLGKLKTE
jgi:hypothetical protein